MRCSRAVAGARALVRSVHKRSFVGYFWAHARWPDSRWRVMSDRPFELARTPEGIVARIRLRGSPVLTSPMLNRGTAFTLAEREALGLTGLLPDGVSTIEGQLRRVYAQYLRQPDDLAKNLYLGNLRDRNEVLYYLLLTEHNNEYLPLV